MANNVVPFGKYKGQPVEAMAADRGYVDWLLAQPWFKDKHQNIYTLIINNFAEPSESPEHNALQVLFLDNEFAKQVVLFHYSEQIFNALWRRRNYWGSGEHEQTKLGFAVGFEVAGADAYVRWTYERYADYGWYGIDDAQFKIEIKPSVGDDYPAILRQVNNIQCPGKPILFVGRYIGVGATREQFVDTFARAGIKVVFHEDVAMADRRLTQEMCDKVNEARALFNQYSMSEIDAELGLAIKDQQQLFSEAIRDGDDEQISVHGDAMCRGWAAALAYVEAARQAEREAEQERQRQAMEESAAVQREWEKQLARWKEDAEIEKAKAVFPDAVVRIREK